MANDDKRGVYFLANDRVIEPTIAFLNSFRAFNPHTPLCLIPYDDNCSRLLPLQDKYDFSWFPTRSALEACDEISLAFHDKTVGAYRKLCIWHGEFDEFAYVDVDTVVLSELDFCFRHLTRADVFTSHSNNPGMRTWVWKDSITSQGILNEHQYSFAANTGFIVSRKGALSIEMARSAVEAALSLKDHMVLHCMEQPFLNYLIVTSGIQFGSLLSFMRLFGKADIKLELWAGARGATVEGGQLRCRSEAPFFLVHWAGPWLAAGFTDFDNMPYAELWKYYRHLQ